MMIKKIVSMSIIVFCIMQINMTNIFAAPQDEITVLLNDEAVVYNDDYGYPFIDKNKRTQVPFRLTLEKFGAIVTWNEEKNTAIAVKDDVLVEVPIGKNYIVRNGEVIINDTTSRIVDDRTYLPIRIVMEAFNCSVDWDEENKEVQIKYRIDILSSKQIPSKYDLRDYGRVSTVKDQGDIGTCWAFAALAALESNLLPNERWDFSEDHLSLLHGYNILQNDGGDLYMALGYLAAWKGPVLEKDDAYGDGIANVEALVQKHLQEAMILPEKDYRAIKSAIILNGGVISSMHIETDQELLDKYFSADMSSYYYNEFEGYNHDIVIIGWDDNYSKENFVIQPKSDGAFLCKSSYGKEFGKDGYFYISYEDTYIGRHNSVYSRIDKTNNYQNIYQADLLGLVGKYGYKDDTAYFANVYETKNDEELLKAVSFYATDEDLRYEIYIVKNFSMKNDLRNREFIGRGTLNYKGYYTVDLEVPILVSDRFAIVVKATAPHSEKPIPLEFKGELPGLEAVIIDDGEGYISDDGRYWDDTEKVLEGNVNLKAFTDNVQ